jgi:hypothetical protein
MGDITREEILNMPAGIEMNTLIEEKIFHSIPCDKWLLLQVTINGSTYNKGNCGHDKCYPRNNPPQFSNNKTAALDLLDEFDYVQLKRLGKIWDVYLEYGDSSGHCQYGDMPLAISRAALLTMIGYLGDILPIEVNDET